MTDRSIIQTCKYVYAVSSFLCWQILNTYYKKLSIYLNNDLSTGNIVLRYQPKYSFEQTNNAKQYAKD